MPLAGLFATITLAFAAIAVWSASAGSWVIAVCAAALAVWMGSLAWSVVRRMRA